MVCEASTRVAYPEKVEGEAMLITALIAIVIGLVSMTVLFWGGDQQAEDGMT